MKRILGFLTVAVILCSCAHDGLDSVLSVNDGNGFGGSTFNGATNPDGSPNPDGDSQNNGGTTTGTGQGGSIPPSPLPPIFPGNNGGNAGNGNNGNDNGNNGGNTNNGGSSGNGSNGGTVGQNPGSNGGSNGSNGGSNNGSNNGGSNGSNGGTVGSSPGSSSGGGSTNDPDADECKKILGKNAKLIVISGNQKNVTIEPYGLAMLKVTGNKCSLKVQSQNNQPVGGLCIYASGNQSQVDVEVDTQVDHFYYKGSGNQSQGHVNVTNRGHFGSSVKVDLKGNQSRLDIKGNGYNYSGYSR